MKPTVLFPALVAASLLILPAGGSAAENKAGLSSLQGAWIEQSMDCAQVFKPAKRGMAFRPDVSVFAPAMVVSGRRIATPGATCTIQSISQLSDRMTLNLGCTTTITTSPVKAYVSVAQDGSLVRYNNATDSVGSKYEACKP